MGNLVDAALSWDERFLASSLKQPPVHLHLNGHCDNYCALQLQHCCHYFFVLSNVKSQNSPRSSFDRDIASAMTVLLIALSNTHEQQRGEELKTNIYVLLFLFPIFLAADVPFFCSVFASNYMHVYPGELR